jgi:tRNA1(Val) A37 N6-methylase TrmN6
MIYDIRANGKEHGTVSTKAEIVNYILNTVGLFSHNSLYMKKILDPAVGEGTFIIPIIEKILEIFHGNYRKVISCLQNITAYEIDIYKYITLKNKLTILFDNNNLHGYEKYINLFNEDYLLANTKTFDIIIGNPPYIRYDKIPKNKIEFYKQLFSCFKYRCDIYIPFIEKGLKTLNKNGVLSFICPDRWLNNQYGRPLRLTIKNNFSYKEIIKIENFNPFNEEVIAYPIIATITNSKKSNIYYYTVNSIKSLNSVNIKKSAKIINTLNDDGELVLSDMGTSLSAIEEQGFKIGIGVASGADEVFIINKKDNNIEDEVLIPIVTKKDVNGESIEWKNNYIINPFDMKTGKLIKLSNYPVLNEYLIMNKSKLDKRYIARKNPNNWYRTIDKIDVSIINIPKLLIPDISTKNIIYFDNGHYYPHHNFYYITGSDVNDLLLLNIFLSTKFVNNQIKEKCTLMNGGALRRQAQTLRKIKIPNIHFLSNRIKNEIICAYENKSKEFLESLINSIIE